LTPSSTLILDGVCLEYGGAYAFTGKRDLAAVLRLAYRDTSLDAAAITNRPRIEAEGLSLLTYRSWDSFAYGDDLLVYDYSRKTIRPLPDVDSAQDYFEHNGFAPERDCPPGFAWGWNAQ
jgi:hypothetical protein